MSKDIRSFFVVKNSKSGQQQADQSSKKPGLKLGQKKRPIVIDSDSDEESKPVKPNNKRSKPLDDSSAKKKDNHKKPEVPETKSKYFESHNVSIKDIFNNTPVKRDTSRKIIKRIVTNRDKESHFEKDFESELAKLEDTLTDVICKGDVLDKETICMIGDKESPEKINTDDGQVKNRTRISPLKKKSDVVYDESPKKKFKFKSEEKEDAFVTREDKNNDTKVSSPDNDIKFSPKKGDVGLPKTSLFEKSPSKNIFSNKTPQKDNTLKIPEKSPYKKLSPTRERRESPRKEKSKLNGEITQNNNSNVFKTEDTKRAKREEESPKKRSLENCGKISDKQKTLNENEISGKTKKKDSSSSVKNDVKLKKEDEATSSVPSNLWVERYKPTTTKQIIGQQGDKSCVNKLISWLSSWEKNQSGTKKLLKPSPWAKNDDGAFFKAALLSGPPGVGKTTTAHLVCKELGFDIVEFNASDTRSKRLLHEEVSELLSTKSLSPFFTGKGDQVTKKHVLLMDEVDGMAGNEDRGGVQELISLIKQSRVPVVCMCNDRNHPKIRSLANYCFDLRFSKPRVEMIRGAMMSVCFKEKLKLKPDELTDIITSANQDIRLIMNHLSMLSMEKTSLAHSTKHIKLGPWDIVRKIFSEQDHKLMSIHDKCDLFFHDYSVTPLFVQENYLSAVPHKPEAKNKIKKMELFAKAATSLSFGDLTEKSIRSHNAWGLLPVQAIFSSLVPGEVLEGHLGAQINFPAWFGKNSRQTKMSRLVQELTVHSRLKISGNREAMNLDYLASLGNAITSPLLHKGVGGVPAALSVLSEYCLVREDMESIAELSTWPGSKNQFAEVESKVKAAFTRAYNKTSVPTPYAAVPVKKGRGENDNSEGLGEEDDVGTQDIEDEEEEGLETDGMIMVKKKPAGKKTDKDIQPSTSKGSKTSKRGRKK